MENAPQTSKNSLKLKPKQKRSKKNRTLQSTENLRYWLLKSNYVKMRLAEERRSLQSAVEQLRRREELARAHQEVEDFFNSVSNIQYMNSHLIEQPKRTEIAKDLPEKLEGDPSVFANANSAFNKLMNEIGLK